MSSPPSRGWTCFPFVLVRIPCIPVGDLAATRHHRALELHTRARRLQEEAASLAVPLIEVLHALVPRVVDRALRGAVIKARRALFQGAPLPLGDWQQRLSLVEATKRGLDAYRSVQHERTCALHDRDAAFDADTANTTNAFLRLFRAPSFRLGLTLANRRLAEQLDALDTIDTIEALGPLDKRRRQTLLRAARYLMRATYKCTPRGFFAATAIAELPSPSDELPQAPGHLPSLSVRMPVAMPNRAVFRSVADTLLAHPAVRAGAILCLAPTFSEDAGVASLLRSDEETSYRRIAIEPNVCARLLALPPGGLPRDAMAAALWPPAETPPAERAAMAAMIDLLVEQGVLVAQLDTSESEVNDGDALARLLWRAVPSDLSLLGTIAQLAEYETALREAASMEPSARALALSRCESLAAALPGVAEPSPPPLLFEDTVCADPVSVRPDDWSGFFDEVTLFGAEVVHDAPSVEEEVLAALFRKLSPGEKRAPLLRFHRRYLEFCAASGLAPDLARNAAGLCERLGLPARSDGSLLEAEVERALVAAGDGDAVVRSLALPNQRSAARASGERLSVRFTPAAPGPEGARIQLVFWGSDRMSLFPRYARLPGAERMRDAFRAWMRRWPEVADLYSSLGRNVDLREPLSVRLLDAPGARPREDGTSLRTLFIQLDESGDRLVLVDDAGRRVRPVFFGVSAHHLQPAIVRFLVFFAGMRTSLLDLTTHALNRALWTRMSSAPKTPLHVPAVRLGRHILLSPPAVVIDPRRLPPVGPTVDRAGFFAFHDWLSEHRIPRVVQVCSTLDEPIWVDFHHPTGIDSFLRYLRHSEVALLYPADNEGTICAQEGAYRAEFYAELAVN